MSELINEALVAANDVRVAGGADYSRYADNPVGFGRDVLGASFTSDLEQVMLSVRDNVVTVAKSATGVGKTFTAARIAVWFYKTFEDAQVWTTATPENNLKLLLWGEIGGIIENNADLFAGDNMRVMHIARNAQSFITGVPISTSGTREERIAKFSGKHPPHLLFILDEGDTIPAEIFEAVEGCMSGGHARMLVMFNPKAQKGPVYQMERDGRANVVELSALNHPNVVIGEDVIPGCVSRETTVRRINEWSRPLADGESATDSFDVPEFLVGCTATSYKGSQYPPLPAGKRAVTNSSLSYMTLGKYPAQAEDQLISRAWCDAAVMRWRAYVAQHGEAPPADIVPLVGLDVADLGRDSNALCFRYGGFVPKPQTWNGVDPDATAIKAAEICRERGDVCANVDATGVGAGVAPRMMRLGVRARSIKVAESPTKKTLEKEEFAQLRDQIWWETREWLRTDSGAMLPPDERLINGLTAPQYSKNTKGKIKVTEKKVLVEQLGYSPDEADALCLTFAPQAGVMSRKIKI